jgi:hypothetical protein
MALNLFGVTSAITGGLVTINIPLLTTKPRPNSKHPQTLAKVDKVETKAAMGVAKHLEIQVVCA